jgi:hypothetical protein
MTMPISTADCRAFLESNESSFIQKTMAVTKLSPGDWSRQRKYKDGDGLVARDFVNKVLPVVVTLVEDNGSLRVSRERALFRWEFSYGDAHDRWYDNSNHSEKWEEEIMWPSCRPSDFRFGVSVDPGYADDDPEGTTFFFSPVTKDNDWDQHTPINVIIEASGKDFPYSGDEVSECSWVFEGDMDLVRDALIEVGFIHDKSLNDINT